MSTRTKIAVALIGAQIAALAFMAGEREWVLRQGRIMYLRTAPVDPRDPMRGDYVRFDYEAAHVPRRLWRDGITGWSGSWPEPRAIRNRRVFAQVQPDDEGIAQLVSISDREPTEGTYLRARVAGIQPHGLDLRFGVEALFMEQGTARKLEESRNARAGVPLNIEVAVSPSGLAVMKGYRWEPLGITVTPDPVEPATRTVPPNGTPPPWTLRGVTVELKNHSTAPVAIVALPDARSFRLVPNERWIEAPHRWAGENTPRPPPTADAVRVLQPGETHRERIDFTSPGWWLREKRAGAAGGWSEPMPWAKLNQRWSASFRIEYVPPTRAESSALPQANPIRHSRLTSRAFGASGRVD